MINTVCPAIIFAAAAVSCEMLFGNRFCCLTLALQNAATHSIEHCGATHCRPTAELSDRHLQLQLLHVLLQEQGSDGASRQEGASLFARSMQRPSCLPPTPSGPSNIDMPGMSMNRDQLMRELFRLELDCQPPQVCSERWLWGFHVHKPTEIACIG